MQDISTHGDLERRKKVRVRLRHDLAVTPQKYEGRTYYIVKEPFGLRYYRYTDREHFLLQLLDGTMTLDEVQKKYEARFRPERLSLEEVEAFAQQLLKAGLVYNDNPQFGQQLYDRYKKQSRSRWFQTWTNILYVKIPILDPDALLNRMLGRLRWIFTLWFMALSVGVILAALFLVASHFQAFRDKMPDYQEFFSFRNLLVMWAALGVVKIIHEFGHGLTCKAFGGEVHGMGILFLCLSPCLYCDVSDSWTLPSKWRRILISAAGIYVELMIAALATFVWWNSPGSLFVNRLALSLMVVCGISTVVFNANPLMRFDGYYVLADWLEIPNLRERSNRFLMRLVQEHCLGMELRPEPYMAPGRRAFFVIYAVVSYIYQWMVTFGILWFLYMFLKPYKLDAVGAMLGWSALASMIGRPLYRLGKSLHQRGRLPDMKMWRVLVSSCALALLFLCFFLVPLPVSRVRQTGLVQVRPDAADKVYVQVPGDLDRVPGILEQLHVRDGQFVPENFELAKFRNLTLESELVAARIELSIRTDGLRETKDKMSGVKTEADRGKLQVEIASIKGEQDQWAAKVREYETMRDQLVLKAPRAGVVMGPPRIEDLGKQWDKDRTTPFCSIGDPRRLWVLLPVTTAEYNLLKEDRREALSLGRDLSVELRVQGREGRIWRGAIAQMPESEAKDVPLALTDRAGGPIAVKSMTQAGDGVPQQQQYLLAIDIQDPDDAICPGTFAQVKIHCRWHSCAWWLWRTLNEMFDLGLI